MSTEDIKMEGEEGEEEEEEEEEETSTEDLSSRRSSGLEEEEEDKSKETSSDNSSSKDDKENEQPEKEQDEEAASQLEKIDLNETEENAGGSSSEGKLYAALLKVKDQEAKEETNGDVKGDTATSSLTLHLSKPDDDKDNDPPPPNKTSNKKKEKKTKEQKKKDKRGKNSQAAFHCAWCNITVQNHQEMQAHSRTEQHTQTVMSDTGRHWKHRAPPRGVGPDSTVNLCREFANQGTCRLGPSCGDAHSADELSEWRDRIHYRHAKLKKSIKACGKTFQDGVLDKLATKKAESILRTRVDGISCVPSSPLDATIPSKSSTPHTWTFEIKSHNQMLQNVALLNDVHKGHFGLEVVKHSARFKSDANGRDKQIRTFRVAKEDGENVQEWSHPNLAKYLNSTDMTYRVTVSFKADIFGKFRQSVIFNFGLEPYLRQDICVDVISKVDEEQEDEKEEEEEDGIKKAAREFQEKIIKQPERWDAKNSLIIDFDPPLMTPDDYDEPLLTRYPQPQPKTFKVSSAVVDPAMTRDNYKQRMRDLLYIEEMAQFEQLTQFNVVTKLHLTERYLLMPTSTNSSTAKYARPGEMFGKMALGQNLSEDTAAGRLILTNCSMLLLSKPETRKEKKKKMNDKSLSSKRTTYTSAIEDTGKNALYLRLSPRLVSDLSLSADDDLEIEVQFQLNRVPLCEMHHAVALLDDLSLVYPDVDKRAEIPWNPGKQWAEDMEARLNPKQREAIVAITTPLESILPPVLIIGPYGTGKTFTLGQAIKLLIKQEGAKVLVCTHSNSAADLYIREYLDPHIQEDSSVKLVRVYYKHRWVTTVNTTVQKYCLIDQTETSRSFRNPTKADVEDCNIVVATLSTSRSLSTIGLDPGHFTHILIDEAAQAMECEALMPLALASSRTRIVLAGDHMQLSPEVFSPFATSKQFNKSLLERLYDLYPPDFPCKILLCENYRSHEAIIGYTSELFYDQRLIASGKQCRHDKWHPLTMFTARGEDVQDANSTSFYNNSEVWEVVERVAELQRTWPKSWGKRDDTSVGVVTPYYDQVQRIRSELRKRKLFGVSVERVLNVQGKQFRAIFLSTVRTRKTCVNLQEDLDCDFGFLSNAKLLNTAITRAQSLVAVVGDPITLCSVGKCRKLWERFLELSNAKDSLFGLTFGAFKTMMNSVEHKKTYVLNPEAPEFVPKAHRFKDPFLAQQLAAPPAANNPPAHQQPHLGTPLGVHGQPTLPMLPPMLPPPPHPHQMFLHHNQPPPPAAAAGLRTFPPPPAYNNYNTYPPFPPGMPPRPPNLLLQQAAQAQMAAAYAAAAHNTNALLAQGNLNMPPPRPPPITWPSQPPKLPIGLPPAGLPAGLPPPRPMSPSRRMMASHQQQQTPPPLHPAMQYHMHQRQQFNGKFRFPPDSPTGLLNSLPLMGMTVPPPPGGAASGTPSEPVVKPELESQFTYLNEGVHYPSRPTQMPLQKMPSNPQLDGALRLLPDQLVQVDTFLNSPELAQAWHSHLIKKFGQREADQFKEVLAAIQQQPELQNILKARQEQLKKPEVLRAEDLEAEMLSERPRHQEVLMPDARTASAYFAGAAARTSNAAVSSNEITEDLLRQDPVLSDILKLNRDEDGPRQSTWRSLTDNGTESSTINTEDASASSIPLYLRGTGAFSEASEPRQQPLFSQLQQQQAPVTTAAALQRPSTFEASKPLPMFQSPMSEHQPAHPPLPGFTSNLSELSLEQRSPALGTSAESNQPMSYANVLRASQNKREEREVDNTLQSLRKAGTIGNQEVTRSTGPFGFSGLW